MADILIAPASTMEAAPTGQVTLFLNTENNNILSYINDQGQVFVYNTGDTSALEECCSCEIAKKWMDAVSCALQKGFLTADQYGTITNQGLIVTSTENINSETGAKTCTVEIGPKNPIVVSPVSLDVTPLTVELILPEIGVATQQLTWSILPASASQDVYFTSSNPAVATVNASGLITAVAAGSCVVTVVSASDPSLIKIVNVTVSTVIP